MTVTISCSPQGNSQTEFAEKTRPDYTVNLTATAIPSDPAETTLSTTCVGVTYSYYDGLNNTPIGQPVDVVGLTLTAGVNSCTMVGTFDDPFSDIFTYVSKGSTNNVETPTVIIGVSNMVPNKEYYDLNQDTRAYVILTFNITVVTDVSTYNETATLQVNNEWEGIRSFVDTYYD